MIIYRFERNGIGPYVGRSGVPIGLALRPKKVTRTQKKAQSLYYSIQKTIKSEDISPNIVDARRHKQYLFGCPSKDHLRAYFGNNFKPLFKQGYRIKRYVAPDGDVIKMGIEVAFPVKYHKLQTVQNIKKKTSQ